MFNSSILDVAIGMIFVYLLLSLLCSAANEILELWLKKRATDLERGIRELLIPNSPSGTNNDLVHQLYDHALINGLFKGTYAGSGIMASGRIARLWRYLKGTRLPAYIPSRNFALGLMDLILPGTAPPAPPPPAQDVPAQDVPAQAAPDRPPGPVASGATGATPATFAVSLAAVPPAPAAAIPGPGRGAEDNPLQRLRAALGTNSLIAANPVAQKALIALVDAAGNDVAKARENIEGWYNNSMDRVSGWYKRRSQVFILVIGLFVAIAVNADSVSIAKRLSTDKALRDSVVAAAEEYAKQNASPSPSPAKPAAETTPKQTDSASSSAPKQPDSASTSSPKPKTGSSPATRTASPSPSPSPVSSASVAASPSPPASRSTATAKASPTPSLPAACIKDENSPECKYEKSLVKIQSLGLPMGWDSSNDIQQQWPGWHWKHPGGWWDQLYWHWLGWLLTALAVSLGAPFWFDMLNKLIVVRSTVKPKEKSQDEPSKS